MYSLRQKATYFSISSLNTERFTVIQLNTIQFTHLKHVIQWFLLYSKTCNHHYNQYFLKTEVKKIHTISSSPSHFTVQQSPKSWVNTILLLLYSIYVDQFLISVMTPHESLYLPFNFLPLPSKTISNLLLYPQVPPLN